MDDEADRFPDEEDRFPDEEETPGRFRMRLRSLAMAVALAAVGLMLARDTFLLRMVLGVVGLVAAGAGMLGLGMAASFVGFRLFGMIGRDSARRGPGKDRPWDDFGPT